MDPQYKKMMTAVLIALILSIIAALLIVEFTMRYFAQ